MRLTGCGIYVPERKVCSEEIDQIYGYKKGTTEKITGVKYRYYADSTHNSASEMAKEASLDAIREAGLSPNDIDLIISANATMEQILPYTAALVHKKLGLEKSGIPTLDVNTSCLSFCNALEIANLYLKAKKYNCILIVSSEIPSIGLNYKHIESAGLFGDGAAAFIVQQAENTIFETSFKTYSSGYHDTEVRGGGTKLPMAQYKPELEDEYKFSMNGAKVFKLTKEIINTFFDGLMAQSKLKKEDLDLIIPHQASTTAIKLISKQLQLEDDKVIKIVSEYGNMIAASIPFTLAKCVKENKVKRGDIVLLLGTSAGFSVGGIIFKY